MIPRLNITAWGQTVPWVDERQVEQDLIISRAIIELFNDPFLKDQLRFRGGTALNKLHLPEPLRYSEDIDLVRTTAGPIGPVLDAVRRILQPWMGQAQFDQSPVAPKLRFRIPAEDKSSNVPIRVKVEIDHGLRAAARDRLRRHESLVLRQGRYRHLFDRGDFGDQAPRASAAR
jgi:Nucleotidyl transferase AbiEii toxin, Type IV TA system